MTGPTNHKHWTKLLLLSLIPLLLTGCWDRLELNDVAFVVATTVDLEEDGRYKVAVQIPLTGQLGGPEGGGGGSGGNQEYYNNYAVADSLMEAYSLLQTRMSRQMKFGHYRLLILGEDFAKQGMKGLFDLLARKPENRLSVFPVVAKGKAFDLLQSQPKLERFPSEAMRELAKLGDLPSFTLKDTAYSLSHIGSDPVLLYMGKKKLDDDPENPIEDIDTLGYAQFHSDRMVGTMDRDAAIGLCWLRGEVKPYTVSVSLDERNQAVFNVIGSRTKLTPSVSESGQVKVNVEIEARLELSENKLTEDIIQNEIEAKLREKAAATIRHQITEAVELMQKNGADSAGIGLTLFRHEPGRWNSLQKEWPERLKEADFILNVDVNIEQIGLITENIIRR